MTVNEVEQYRSLMYVQMISAFYAAINFGASDRFDWDTFIDYCNTPCYRYKVK